MTYQPGPPADDVPRPDAAPGSEPADPWAEEQDDPWAEEQAAPWAEEPDGPWAEEQAGQAAERWSSQSGGMGPVPSRTWTRGNSRIVVGGCCLPLPIGCLTTVAVGAVVAASALRRTRG